MSILTDVLDVSGINSTVDPHMLMDVNAAGMSLTSNPHIPLDQTQSYAMNAPGVKPALNPPEGSTMQVAHHNRANLDHVMKHPMG
jgi:hypothetical protein